MPENNTNEDYDEVKNFREKDASSSSTTTTDVEEEHQLKTSSAVKDEPKTSTPSRIEKPTPTYAQSPIYPMMFPPAALSPAFFPMMMVPNPFLSPNPMLQMQVNPLFGAMSPSFALAAATAQMRLGAATMPLTPMHAAMNQMPMPGFMQMPSFGRHEHHVAGKVKVEKRIKKPRNAFFIFKDEHRLKLRENPDNARMTEADLNKECGVIWATMRDTGEQQKYIELANKEREAHKEQYPDWSASANYAAKKKPVGERKRHAGYDIENKKCRAKFGVDNETMWCLPCRRKKKCIYAKADDVLLPTTSSSSGSMTNGSISSSSSTEPPSSPMETVTHTPDISHDDDAKEEDVRVDDDSDEDDDDDDDEEIDPTIVQLTSEAQQSGFKN